MTLSFKFSAPSPRPEVLSVLSHHEASLGDMISLYRRWAGVESPTVHLKDPDAYDAIHVGKGKPRRDPKLLIP
jgi:hypothetical protein